MTQTSLITTLFETLYEPHDTFDTRHARPGVPGARPGVPGARPGVPGARPGVPGAHLSVLEPVLVS